MEHVVLQGIEYVALAIEVLAVSIIVVTSIAGTVYYLWELASRSPALVAYGHYKGRLGRGLLLGLEMLVAADIIRTVALDPTLANIAALGLLVLIRTFLSWALVLEIEGRWPWQSAARSGRPPAADE